MVVISVGFKPSAQKILMRMYSPEVNMLGPAIVGFPDYLTGLYLFSVKDLDSGAEQQGKFIIIK